MIEAGQVGLHTDSGELCCFNELCALPSIGCVIIGKLLTLSLGPDVFMCDTGG